VADEVLAPVPHRQCVFTIPKMLRIYFRRDRRLPGKLSQCAADILKTLFRAAVKDPRAVPGIIIAIQTYGDLVNFHPHLHALVTDGAFSPAGWLVAFPKIDLAALERLFRHRVLRMLLGERRIDEAVIRTLLGWWHSRFSLHNEVRIGPHDDDGRRAVAEYILRAPFSQEKMRYHPRTGTVIYRSKMHPVRKRNFVKKRGRCNINCIVFLDSILQLLLQRPLAYSLTWWGAGAGGLKGGMLGGSANDLALGSLPS
jgi:hypothetical protein